MLHSCCSIKFKDDTCTVMWFPSFLSVLITSRSWCLSLFPFLPVHTNNFRSHPYAISNRLHGWNRRSCFTEASSGLPLKLRRIFRIHNRSHYLSFPIADLKCSLLIFFRRHPSSLINIARQRLGAELFLYELHEIGSLAVRIIIVPVSLCHLPFSGSILKLCGRLSP